MLFVRLKLVTWWRYVAVALLAGLAGYTLHHLPGWAVGQPADSIPALVAHLEQHGTLLRVVPVANNGDVCGGAYLTRTSKDWDQLSRLMRVPEDLPRWQGTLLVLPEHNTWFRTQARLSWGNGGLVYGRLVVFGDPALLAEVRAVLAAPGPKACKRLLLRQR
jgi:hypothetical protein